MFWPSPFQFNRENADGAQNLRRGLIHFVFGQGFRISIIRLMHLWELGNALWHQSHRFLGRHLCCIPMAFRAFSGHGSDNAHSHVYESFLGTRWFQVISAIQSESHPKHIRALEPGPLDHFRWCLAFLLFPYHLSRPIWAPAGHGRTNRSLRR